MRVLVCLCVVLVQLASSFLAAAEEQTPPSRAQSIANVGKVLTNDISNYAKNGDTDFSALVEKHKLTAVDWDALAKSESPETLLQNIILDILAMRDRSEHAQALIEKYKIQQNKPAEKK
jgi:hypothetical protein